MGAFATFYFGMKWPERALSLTLAGIGSGCMPGARTRFRQESEAAAAKRLAEGWEKSAGIRGDSPTRVRLRNKNPRGFAEFIALVRQHLAKGSAFTLKGYQALRPSLVRRKPKMTDTGMPSLHDVIAARPHVYRYLKPTPLYRYSGLSDLIGANAWVKHENHQPVGACGFPRCRNLAQAPAGCEKRGSGDERRQFIRRSVAPGCCAPAVPCPRRMTAGRGMRSGA